MLKLQRRTVGAIVFHRWCAVIAVGVLFLAVVLVAAWIGRTSLSDVVGLPAWLMLALASAPIVALLLYVGPLQLIGALGLRHTLAHPPYWLGVALGIGGALAAIANVDGMRADFGLTQAAQEVLQNWALVFILIPVGVLGAHTFRWVFREPAGNERWDEGRTAIPSPKQRKLDAWYADDNAVISAADDLLEYEVIAARIARRLVTDRAQAQALLGRLGAGKTTVRYLVEEFLRGRYPKAPITVVSVELWPYDTPAAAVEGILRAVIDALAKHVHTSQLKGLPEAYAEAVATAAGLSSWIPRVRERVSTPSEILRRLDDVVRVIDRRVVLWVDDLERFAFGNPGASDNDPAELGRLSPIRALLYGLDRLESITVVTATTNLFQRFDLEKVARYVERIPDIPPRRSLDIIRQARREWMSRKPYIDPVPNRARLGWEREESGYALLDYAVHDWATAVAALATTPRTLKQALRRVSEVWDKQTGEIDLDELLAMSMVREAVPDAFAVIEQHERKLRGIDLEHRNGKESPVALVSKQVEALNLDQRATKAVALIVKSVFDKHDSGPQGLRQNNHADYWQRFLSGAEIANEESDQSVLRTLRDGTDDDIVRQLSDPSGHAAVGDFARQLTPERVQGLLLPLVSARLDDDPATWEEHKEPPGLIPLWRLLLDRLGSLDQARLADDAIKALELAGPKNIALMQKVQQWMVAQGQEVHSVLPDAERTRVIDRSIELIRDLYTGKPEALAKSLRNAFPYTLYWLFYNRQQRASGVRDEPFDGWPQFADTIRAALAVSPVDIAGQIAALVVQQVDTPDQLLLDRDRCRMLFGDIEELVVEVRGALGGKDAGPLVEALVTQRVLVRQPPEDEEEPVLDTEDDTGHIDEGDDSDEDEDVDDGGGAT